MRTLWVLLAAFTASSCASNPALTDEGSVRTERVEVVVTASCLMSADVPAKPGPPAIDLDQASDSQVIAAIGAYLSSLERYMVKADALLRGCAVNTPKGT